MDTKIFEQPQQKIIDVENNFDLGNINMLTINPGYLVPVFSQYCIPNTEVDYGTDVYGRLMPMINPIYSKYKFYIYNFFVPTRVCFPHFERFRSGKKVSNIDGTSYSPIAPRISLFYIALSSSWQILVDALQGTGANIALTLSYVGLWTNSLPDYLNMPCTNEVSFDRNPQITGEHGILLIDHPLVNIPADGGKPSYFEILFGDNLVSSYFDFMNNQTEDVCQGNRLVFIEKFIAYTLIWYDYFRDWRLEDYQFSPYDFIHECTTEYEGNYNSYYSNDSIQFLTQHPQLNWFALRRRTFTSDMFISAFPTPQLGDAMNLPQIKDFGLITNPIANQNIVAHDGRVAMDAGGGAFNYPAFNFLASQVPTIDDLHFAEQMQKYYQILMVHGINTSDLDKIFYGVYSTKPYDKPVFIDGDTWDFNFDEVLQTSQTTEDSPLGDFAGRGSIFGQLNSSKKFLTDEFGYFLTLVCAVPKQAYFQGLPREFTRKWDIYDLPNPLFAHLGFDNIQEEELFFTVAQPYVGSASQSYSLNKRDFGYVTRYIDSRVHNDEIHGSFRSTLNNWHTSRIFKDAPNLDVSFTNVQHWDFSRIFAVQQFTSPNILLLVRNKFYAKQNLPYYCNPF